MNDNKRLDTQRLKRNIYWFTCLNFSTIVFAILLVLFVLNTWRFYNNNFEALKIKQFNEQYYVPGCKKNPMDTSSIKCSQILTLNASSLHTEAFMNSVHESLSFCQSGSDCRFIVFQAIAGITNSFFTITIIFAAILLTILYFYYRLNRDKMLLQMIEAQTQQRIRYPNETEMTQFVISTGEQNTSDYRNTTSNLNQQKMLYFRPVKNPTQSS